MSALTVDRVELHALENAKEHHTDLFELIQEGVGILRRGQVFILTIVFKDGEYDDAVDLVKLTFTTGSNPSPLRSTWGVANVANNETSGASKNVWQAKELMREGNELKIEVCCPATIPVGLWHLRVFTAKRGNIMGPNVYDHPEDVYFLFNPWNSDDDVYMADDHLLREYILSDVGKIWVGPHGSSRGREWVFGQFDDCVLPAIMLMLERCGLQVNFWWDPVRLSRAISKIVNSNDDQGVLVGRWDGDYEDGVAPAEWTGSVPILEQYLNTGKEVMYGQCWVFAGVVTTVCRALGIPSRVVTNFVSAHDANASLTVDRYFSADGKELKYDPNNEKESEDSVWNYHVWNDVWMSRRDLPKGYGGWQAIDATPQETSLGFYQCGPASLEAIRRGAVGLNYDVPFLLASVNADLVSWREDPSCELGFSKMQCNKYHIGRMVYTKMPFIFDPNGSKDREDITAQYKAKEGSKAERLNLYNGARNSDLAKQFYEVSDLATSDIDFELVDLDTIQLGENFSVTVKIKNKCKSARRVQASLSAASVYYTGIRAHLVKTATGDFTVQPEAKETLRLVIKPHEYMGKLVEYCHMKIYAIARVADTGATWADEDDFQVIKPPIDIQVPDSVNVGEACNVVFSFKNPLKKALTDCRFNCSGSGLSKNTIIPYCEVGPDEMVKVEHSFEPRRSGEHKLVVTFSSRELVDIVGSANVAVM